MSRLYFLEYGIGLKPDAPNNRLTWRLASDKRCGCERFRFGGHTVSLIAVPPDASSQATRVMVRSDGEFDLRIERDGRQWDFRIDEDTRELSLK